MKISGVGSLCCNESPYTRLLRVWVSSPRRAVWQVSTIIKHVHPPCLAFHSQIHTQHTQTHTHAHVHHGHVQGCSQWCCLKQPEIIQMPLHSRMSNYIVIYSHHGMLCNHENKQSLVLQLHNIICVTLPSMTSSKRSQTPQQHTT